MKKLLPFEYPTIVDTYSGIAGNVGAYMNYRKEYMPLLIVNHFLITYNWTKKEVGFNWMYYKNNYGHFTDIRLEAKKEGTIKTIKKYILDNKYIRIILDFYYISNTTWYKDESHLLHYIPQIIGFDDNEECVFLVDNLCDGKYKIIKVPYKEIKEARNGHEDEIFDCSYFDRKIDFILSKYELVELLKSWLDSCCYLKKTSDNIDSQEEIVYGMDVYNVLAWTTEETSKNAEEAYDVRTFHAIINHFDVFNVMLAEWIISTNYISPMYVDELTKITSDMQDLCKRARIMENLYLKLVATQNHNTMKRLLEMIEQIKIQEEDSIRKLIFILQS